MWEVRVMPPEFNKVDSLNVSVEANCIDTGVIPKLTWNRATSVAMRAWASFTRLAVKSRALSGATT